MTQTTPPITPADDYADEAEFRDELAAIAAHYGWQTAKEVPVTVGKMRWGRVDLIIRRESKGQWQRPRPILIECKRKITTLSELRRAVEQVYAYRQILGVAGTAVVTAPKMTYQPSEAKVLLDRFNTVALTHQQVERILSGSHDLSKVVRRLATTPIDPDEPPDVDEVESSYRWHALDTDTRERTQREMYWEARSMAREVVRRVAVALNADRPEASADAWMERFMPVQPVHAIPTLMDRRLSQDPDEALRAKTRRGAR